MKKILVLPGWMSSLELYDEGSGLQLQFGKIDLPISADDIVVGMSLGALIVLRESSRIPGRIILVNPPLPKRNIFHWFTALLRMIAAETPFNNRQKFTRNPFRYAFEVARCIKLLMTDFDAALDAIPKDHLTVIRGRKDSFFADQKTTAYLRKKNVEVIEVDGGHNWSEAIEQSLRERG